MKKVWKVNTSILLVLMTCASLFTFQTDTVKAASGTDWEKVQQLMDEFQADATWSDTKYSGAITGRMPSTAVLGNGDVGVTSYGNATEKTYLLSSNNFWSDNTRYFGYRGRNPQIITGGGLTMKEGLARDPNNLAFNMNTTSSPAAENHEGKLATQGLYSNDLSNAGETFTGFEAKNTDSPAWITIQLLGYERFDRYVIRHDNFTSKKGKNRNTESFKIQILPEGKSLSTATDADWQTLDTVTSNTADETDKKLAKPVTAKYIRLLIDKATADSGDGIARISQLELYDNNDTYKMPVVDNAPSTHPKDLAYGMPASASSETKGFEASKAVNGAYEWQSKEETEKFAGWVSEAEKEQTLTIDLKRKQQFNRWTVKHNNSTAENGANLNTKDFYLEISSDNENWTKIDEVIGNMADTTDRRLLYPYEARYVRLHITKPSDEPINTAKARISQLELYNDKNAEDSIATNSTITATTAMKGRTVLLMTIGSK